MADLTIRMASNLIGYTFAEVTVPCPDDITPEQAARMHWEWNLRFLAEQEKIADEPVTEKQEAAIQAAATETLTQKIPATTVEESKTEAPWEQKPEASAEKPWQKKPVFESLL